MRNKIHRVVWEVDVEEDGTPLSMEDVARMAQKMQRDPTATVGVFNIYNTNIVGKRIGKCTVVDLDEIDGKI